MDKHVALAFPTPVGRYRVADAGPVNAELKRLILDRERSEPSQRYANAGGWPSSADLLDWPSPAVATLKGWIAEAVGHTAAAVVEMMRTTMGRTTSPYTFRFKAWANVSRAGNYHRQHNPPGSCWSGVYFVDNGGDSPGQPLSGLLELL